MLRVIIPTPCTTATPVGGTNPVSWTEPHDGAGFATRRLEPVDQVQGSPGVPGAATQSGLSGEERPFVLGHDEHAWKWNLRVHFVLAR